MSIRTLVAAGTLVAGIALPAASASAAGDDPYVKPPSEVLGTELERPAEVPPAQVESTQVQPAQVVRAGTAPAGTTLPVTGTDVVGLTIIGLSAIAGGTVLVRRSRPRAATQTA